mgnify:CR=1 FL=1
MIMENKGKHVELNSIDESLVSTKLFPKTTADDVVVNDGGAVLSTYLPTINSTNGDFPIKGVEIKTGTMSDTVFSSLKK